MVYHVPLYVTVIQFLYPNSVKKYFGCRGYVSMWPLLIIHKRMDRQRLSVALWKCIWDVSQGLLLRLGADGYCGSLIVTTHPFTQPRKCPMSGYMVALPQLFYQMFEVQLNHCVEQQLVERDDMLLEIKYHLKLAEGRMKLQYDKHYKEMEFLKFEYILLPKRHSLSLSLGSFFSSISFLIPSSHFILSSSNRSECCSCPVNLANRSKRKPTTMVRKEPSTFQVSTVDYRYG